MTIGATLETENPATKAGGGVTAGAEVAMRSLSATMVGATVAGVCEGVCPLGSKTTERRDTNGSFSFM
jgi:hypothetical protein